MKKTYKKSFKKIFIILFKIIILCFAYAFISYKFAKNDLYSQIIIVFKSINIKGVVFIIIVFFLMIINWYIEALKWRYILTNVEKISKIRSFIAVLSGVMLAIFTPNRIGELGGRVFVLQKQNRIKGFFASSVGSFSQLNITIIMGVIGISLFAFFYGGELINIKKNVQLLISVIIVLGAVILLFVFFNMKKLSDFFLKYKFFRKYENQILFIKKFSFTQLCKILLFSLLRYIIFTSQFVMLLNIFAVEINLFEAYISIATIYLIINIIPSIILSDIGIRGSVSIYILSVFSQQEGGIFMASTFLWLINLVIPAIFGSFAFAKTKI